MKKIVFLLFLFIVFSLLIGCGNEVDINIGVEEPQDIDNDEEIIKVEEDVVSEDIVDEETEPEIPVEEQIVEEPQEVEEEYECYTDSDCDDNDDSTEDECTGTPKTCSNLEITSCVNNDDYCPNNCVYDDDNDCEDPNSCSVDSDCDDDDASTYDRCSGSECTYTEIDHCYSGDDYCPNLCMYYSDYDCEKFGPYDGSGSIDMDILLDKDTYSVGEYFEATPYMDFSGNPFEALIIYELEREGFSEPPFPDIVYKGYLEVLTSDSLVTDYAAAGATLNAYVINEQRRSSHSDSFEDAGTYYMTMHLLDCDEVANAGHDCEQSGVFLTSLDIGNDEEDILDDVSALVSVTKTIVVS